MNTRVMEYAQHGDALVPRQQRFGRYTRSLMKGLGIPVENRWGLRPALVKGTERIAPLVIARDLDRRGWLAGVSSTPSLGHAPPSRTSPLHIRPRAGMNRDAEPCASYLPRPNQPATASPNSSRSSSCG